MTSFLKLRESLTLGSINVRSSRNTKHLYLCGWNGSCWVDRVSEKPLDMVVFTTHTISRTSLPIDDEEVIQPHSDHEREEQKYHNQISDDLYCMSLA